MNQITFTNLPECFQITIIEATEVFHHFGDHFHNSYNIGILKSGTALLGLNGAKHQIKPGTIYFLNPRVIHSLQNLELQISYTVISIPEEVLLNLIKNQKPFSANPLSEDLQKSQTLLKQIQKILTPDTLPIEQQEILIDILDSFQFLPYQNFFKKEQFEKTILYLKEHFKEPITLNELCQLSFISPYHFIREFKRYTGLSPTEYLIQLRIKAAQKLLLQTTNLAIVAQQLGFYDQSHFSKYFKKHLGISPRKYLQSYKKR